MEETEKTTPMMAQYRLIKEQNLDKVLFFRLGDFYEMFDTDAVEVSRLLNLTLTKRAGQAMCGIPYHAAKVYIKRLLDLGKKIAICEQVELNDNPKQLARREVVQVVSPATVVDDDFLDSRSNSYVLCIAYHRQRFAVSYTDITNGEFTLRSTEMDKQFNALLSIIEQVKPREILVNEDDYFLHLDFQRIIDAQNAMITKLPSWFFKAKDGYALMCEQVGTTSLKAFSLDVTSVEITSGGALLRYVIDSAKTGLAQIRSYTLADESEFLQIDESSRKNLELLLNLQDGNERYTLFSSLDSTVTSGGARLLKKWISFPLINKQKILDRQNWVKRYSNDRLELDRTRTILKGVLDLERLTSRIAMGRSLPHDLVGIARTVKAFLELVSDSFALYHPLFGDGFSDELMQQLIDEVQTIDAALNDQCQGPFVEGLVILDGFDPELDSLRSTKANGKQILDDYLAKVRLETGITTIKLSSNKILGHFLEVSKGQVDKVPSSFYRKQTLVNAERYTSDELIACETKILKSSFEAEKRERFLYEKILSETRELRNQLLSIGNFLSQVDCLQAFATTSIRYNYCCPVFTDTDCLEIQGGRHPVVEQQLGIGAFVANDLTIKPTGNRFCLITGPNMAGKSTFLRQSALIVLLAQIGSFVPATSVKLSLVDRLFCRVGSSDNLARGESTFLVEMQEAAHILRTASPHSLVIMDELGRGTSTQDGMSIAYAVMQSLLEMGPKTLFATHYHELAQLDTSLVQLLTLQVIEKGGEIIFVRKVIEGIANSSYGLNVAKMAGIPTKALRTALSFQKRHFSEYGVANPQLDLFASDSMESNLESVISLTEVEADVLETIRSVDIPSSTPIAALLLLEELKKKLDAN
jgi:DNA mismatch repair protein MutS